MKLIVIPIILWFKNKIEYILCNVVFYNLYQVIWRFIFLHYILQVIVLWNQDIKNLGTTLKSQFCSRNKLVFMDIARNSGVLFWVFSQKLWNGPVKRFKLRISSFIDKKWYNGHWMVIDKNGIMIIIDDFLQKLLHGLLPYVDYGIIKILRIYFGWLENALSRSMKRPLSILSYLIIYFPKSFIKKRVLMTTGVVLKWFE